MEPPSQGRPANVHRLGPGSCCLVGWQDDPDLALIVAWDDRRGALLLNRRADGGYLPLAPGLDAGAGLIELRGAFLAPSGPTAGLASGGVAIAPAALHVGPGRAYLCGRDKGGDLTTFDVASGLASAVNLAALPHTERWRVMVPQGSGLVTLYEAGPA
ncbi:hypothetical protein ACRAWG_02580 [Methylobacterium sp. P31]